MKELGEALKLLFSKIGDFFDILDLSFFVSGITCLAAILTWVEYAGGGVLGRLHGTPATLLGILACYVTGCLCFALGRWLRQWLWPRMKGESAGDRTVSKMLRSTLAAHGLSDRAPFREYLARDETLGGPWRLYVRLWAEVRQTDRCLPSFTLIRRYWVLAATYDGLAVAMVAWGVVIAVLTWSGGPGGRLLPGWGGGLACLFLLLLATMCLREAARYVKFQVEELVATIAVEVERGG
jgi:hypothetical protein